MKVPGYMLLSVDDLFHLAESIATCSPDPNKQVGALVIKKLQVLAIDCNRPPPRVYVRDIAEISPPAKADWFEHAERNVIYTCAQHGIPLEGATMVTTWFPCVECARAIVAAGFESVYCGALPQEDHPRYNFKLAREILDRADVRVFFKKGAT